MNAKPIPRIDIRDRLERMPVLSCPQRGIAKQGVPDEFAAEILEET